MPDFQTGFYFSLGIQGEPSDSDAAFQEASGLSAEMGVEEVVSGGENRFKYRLPSIVTYPNLVLKRGIAFVKSPLVAWCHQIMTSGLALQVVTKDLTLNLLNADGQASMSWSFAKAYPLKWSVSDLKSQENSMLIETIELAYQYFKVTDPRSGQ